MINKENDSVITKFQREPGFIDQSSLKFLIATLTCQSTYNTGYSLIGGSKCANLKAKLEWLASNDLKHVEKLDLREKLYIK